MLDTAQGMCRVTGHALQTMQQRTRGFSRFREAPRNTKTILVLDVKHELRLFRGTHVYTALLTDGLVPHAKTCRNESFAVAWQAMASEHLPEQSEPTRSFFVAMGGHSQHISRCVAAQRGFR